MSVLKLQKNLTFGLGRVIGNFKCPISTLTGKEIVVKEWKGDVCVEDKTLLRAGKLQKHVHFQSYQSLMEFDEYIGFMNFK